MINKNSFAATVVVVLGLILVSCAEPSTPNMTSFGTETFKAWLAKNDPQALAMPSGVYINFRERGNLGFFKPKPDTSWLRLDYTIHSMNGIIAITRDSTRAKLLGTWVPPTHFVDDFLPYKSTENYAFPQVCEGLRDAFQYLRVGDSARIYIPAPLAYTLEDTYLYFNSGTIGQQVSLTLMPIYIDVRVKDIINNPKPEELARVQDYVRLKWGMSDKDSIGYGLYMRLVEDYPSGDEITKDSSVRYFYAERFVDRHLVKTDVEKVAQAAQYLNTVNWEYGVSSFASTGFSLQSSDTTNQRILAKVFLKMKSGQTVEVISTSEWASYGNQGKVSSTPQILPFEPRIFHIKTLKWDQSDKEVDYDFNLLK